MRRACRMGTAQGWRDGVVAFGRFGYRGNSGRERAGSGGRFNKQGPEGNLTAASPSSPACFATFPLPLSEHSGQTEGGHPGSSVGLLSLLWAHTAPALPASAEPYFG